MSIREVSEEHSSSAHPNKVPLDDSNLILVELPELCQKSFEQQTEHILLAWILYLYRVSLGSDDYEPCWSPQAASQSAADIRQFHPLLPPQTAVDGATAISTILDSIHRLHQGRNFGGQSDKSTWQEQHLVLAAIQALTHDEQNKPNLHFSIEVWTSDRTLYARPISLPVNLTLEMAHVQIEAFTDVLQSVLVGQEKTVAQATKVGRNELGRIWQWNGDVPPTIDRCMHDIISEKMSLHPDRQAVVSWEGALTYGQLDNLSRRLAFNLIDTGVGLGTVVPLCFEKSIWTVVALLAVMRSGAAFVLTDPQQPEGRLRVIAEEVGAQVLVTSWKQRDLATRIAPSAKVVAIGPELLEPQSQLLHSTVPLQRVPSSSILYIIFTSGSTGKPKGVVISHANFTTGAIPRANAVGYKAHSRVLDFPSYAFDVSIDCMLCTLAQGGTICVPSDDQRVNDLGGAIRSMQVNMAHMTPSVARLLDPDIMASLEVLGLGGESLSTGDALAWSKLTRLIIAYGPSECTVGCTINSNVVAERSYTSIGVGQGGVTWIVDPDDHNSLTPVGGVGELLIEGGIVGVGYLNQAEKTSEVFIENPQWLVEGCGELPGRHGRLYKTGDLVRYDPDGSGSIVFVGRKDRQVKLRGQRVELAEIEYHLRTRLPPGTNLAAEVIRPGQGTREPTLVVFISEPRENRPLGLDDDFDFSMEFRQTLITADGEVASELPRYMMPTAYIPLEELPLLVSCKIDRKRLQQIGSDFTPQTLARYRAKVVVEKQDPVTELEKSLSQVWRQVLGVDSDIDLQDNFFALGGDSLKAMRLVTVAKASQISLTVADIFSSPTLSSMASKAAQEKFESEAEIAPFSLLPPALSKEKAQTEAAKLCGLDVFMVEDLYPCTPLQEGLLALSAKMNDAYVAQRVVSIPDRGKGQRLQMALAAVAEDCPILRTRIVHIPGHGLFQVVVNEAVPWTNTSGLNQYLVTDRSQSMGLGDSLVRFALVTEDDSASVSLVLTIHHALYDGWSMPLIIERVNRTYQGLKSEKPTPFNAFVKYLHQGNRAQTETYWKEQLDGASGLQFPFLPHPGYQTHADSLVEHFIELTPSVGSNITLATRLRAAWALVSSRYSGTSDVVFAETLTGRNAPITGVSSIEGPLITTVPWRVRIGRNNKVSELLQSVHDQAIMRIPHEHLGLQHIRRLSADARDACELRTGIVLNLLGEVENRVGRYDDARPADGFVPVDDLEAAREALKFNSYALMLVFTMTPKGVLIMASFDSNTVEEVQLKQVLKELDVTLQDLQQDTDRIINDLHVSRLTHSSDVAPYRQLGVDNILVSLPDLADDGFSSASGFWIVESTDHERLVTIGAVGELLVDSPVALPLPLIKAPEWLLQAPDIDKMTTERSLYATGYLARYLPNKKMVIMASKQKPSSLEIPVGVDLQDHSDRHMDSSATLHVLRRLWSRILGTSEEGISPEDTFFGLGGDSIGAMKLVSEARIEGLELTVAQVFQYRRLSDMAKVAKNLQPVQDSPLVTTPFSALEIPNLETFLSHTLKPQLLDQDWIIQDVLPTRPLQKIAIKGTCQLPRYSARYELIHLAGGVDRTRLFESCQELVARNEILRTIFLRHKTEYISVVIEKLLVPFVEYEIEGDLESFCKRLCEVDVQTKMALGSTFVKFFFVQGEDDAGTLIFRISHAQYDEICLPIMLRQLSALYEGKKVPDTLPFSCFTHHVLQKNIPQSIPYWRELLRGASMTRLLPDVRVTNKKPVSVFKSFQISGRSKEVTLATFPTAAWSLCLARQLNTYDVVFGEVVSGRGLGNPNGDIVAGPCWQYVPVRVKFLPSWTGMDLLRHIQKQHAESSHFEGIGLEEIVQNCTDWPDTVDWFDSVVHQDVEHVENLNFLSSTSRLETYYPHLEPLREWKIQAFFKGDTLTLEIVTFESWLDYANKLLDNLGDALHQLVEEAETPVFRQSSFNPLEVRPIRTLISESPMSPSDDSPATPELINDSPVFELLSGSVGELEHVTLDNELSTKVLPIASSGLEKTVSSRQ